MPAPTPPPLPPLLAAVMAGAQFVLTRRGRRTVPTSVLGALTAAAGGAVAFVGHHEFTTVHTTADPNRPGDASTLVTKGVFRYTRNPMYLGLTLILLGHALHRRDLRALLPVAAFVGVIDRAQIAREETALSQLFGQAYADYRAATRRWL